MSRFLVLWMVLLSALVGCSPAPQESAAPLPTIARLPSPTPGNFTLTDAERVARTFLESWRAVDLETMHSLLTFASQEATPLDTFVALYENTHDTLTLTDLTYQLTSQIRDTASVMAFNYNVMFETRLLGTFYENNRVLRLAFDERVGEWRVAWSPGDIFEPMGRGGQLRLEPRIPSRANIYDRDGGILADQHGRVVTVSIIRRSIPDYEACVGALADVLDRPLDDMRALVDSRPLNWLAEVGVIEPLVYVNTHERLEEICGAQFRDRPARRYADGTLAPHILGFVGYPDEAEVPAVVAAGFPQDTVLGRSGIERTWDETLRGSPGGRLLLIEPDGTQTVLAEAASRPSESLWLTIDTDLQAFVVRELATPYTEGGWGSSSNGAAAVVMDLNTGEILAMASYPGFDNNAFNLYPSIGREAAEAIVASVQADERRPQLNRATQGTYPAGSTFKVVPAIAAADSGVYELDHRYNSTGIWNRDLPRTDWLRGGHGLLTLPQFLKYSCNSCFYETGWDLDAIDPDLLPDYARRLGLGGSTGLRDLPEDPGIIAGPEWLLANYGLTWTASDAVSLAIGQGYMTVTPLQMTRMFAALGNGGYLYRPQVVRQAGILGEVPSYVMEPDMMSDIAVREDVLMMVQDALCTVTTENGGTAEHIFRRSPLQDLVVCGKTGTAQDPRPAAPPHAWFAAYAPRENPEVAIAVIVENTADGSAVAAPIVRDILEYYFFGEDFPG